jgi:hypothetical protein
MLKDILAPVPGYPRTRNQYTLYQQIVPEHEEEDTQEAAKERKNL